MTPQELKNSILQLAIQGKLVEQRPEEGTAEELYRQIQAEKQALIKAGKIKKEKPLPEITEDEIPFDIPESWEWVKLGELCSILTGKKDANFGSNAGKYYFFTCAKVPIRCDSFSFSGEAILMAGNGDIGNLSYYYGDFEAYQRTYVLQPYIEFSYLKYILYHLLCNWVPYNNDKTFGTAIPYIRLGNVQNYIVALPPLAEQKRIVAKIEELLPLIDRYEEAWTKLENFNKRFPMDMQKSLLQMAIQGKLVEQRPEEGTGEELYKQIQAEKQALIKAGKIKKEKPLPEITDDEKPFDIPDSWMWIRLGNVISLLSGTDFKPEEYNDKQLGIPYITGASSLSSNGVLVNRWTETPRVIANRGDLLIVCKGSGYGKVVTCNIDKAHIARQIMAIKYLDAMCMNYIRYFLQANIAHIKAHGQGVIPGIDRSSIQNMFFPLPPLAEQKRIVAKLEELLPLCEKLK